MALKSVSFTLLRKIFGSSTDASQVLWKKHPSADVCRQYRRFHSISNGSKHLSKWL